jgi:hypothetical protein
MQMLSEIDPRLAYDPGFFRGASLWGDEHACHLQCLGHVIDQSVQFGAVCAGRRWRRTPLSPRTLSRHRFAGGYVFVLSLPPHFDLDYF